MLNLTHNNLPILLVFNLWVAIARVGHGGKEDFFSLKIVRLTRFVTGTDFF